VKIDSSNIVPISKQYFPSDKMADNTYYLGLPSQQSPSQTFHLHAKGYEEEFQYVGGQSEGVGNGRGKEDGGARRSQSEHSSAQ
jgi:hypothetical protein